MDVLAFITISTTMLGHHDQKKPREVACTLIRSQIKMKPLYQFLIPHQHRHHLTLPKMALGIGTWRYKA